MFDVFDEVFADGTMTAFTVASSWNLIHLVKLRHSIIFSLLI